MEKLRLIRLTDEPERKEQLAAWFHEMWGIPEEAYLASMEDAIRSKMLYPQWYAAMDGDRIVAGMGVIENDFHNRKDLHPNVCAVFTVPEYRGRGIAGMLLNHVCEDMAACGIRTLYLLTDHTGFYERYGWKFYCLALGDGEKHMSRMYIHEIKD